MKCICKSGSRYTFFSVTTDNPFLPESYINQLKTDLDPRLARRMIYGEWLEIRDEVIYYSYDKSLNFRNYSYKIDAQYPIHISWDFNIGEGKPLSVVLFQFINDKMHIFNEVVVHGMRTEDSCEELQGRGFLGDYQFIINGDASGKNRDTRNNKSDYDIIRKFFANANKRYDMDVPLSNPPLRLRHNTVNSYCKNEAGDVRLFVYKEAKTADEGLRLTQLKSGGQYTEDDSKPYQHITTAIGYGLVSTIRSTRRKPQGSVRL